MNQLLDDVKHAAKHGTIFLTNHARERGDERRFRVDDLRAAILAATDATLQANGSIQVSGAALTVICRLIRPGLLILTAF